MRLGPSLALVLALMAPPLAASQQGAGGLTQSITREARRLGAEPADADADAAWKRIGELAPGTHLLVTVNGSPAAERFFLAATPAALVVLDLALLPQSLREVLRNVAATRPSYFAAARQGATLALEQNARLGPDGVFVGGQAVARLDQIVAEIPRTEVVEVRARPPYSPERDARFGFLAGTAVCGAAAVVLCHANGGGCGTDALVAMGVCGGVNAGIALAAGAVARPFQKDKTVIYHAP